MHIRKGNEEGNPVVAWSAIMDCLRDRCRIEDQCHYQKKGKCDVQVQFLQVTLEMIRMENPALKYNQAYRIGLHLVPLYKTLCKLYMDELAVSHPTYTTEKGTRQSHPVYKEIRDTLKMIMMVWKDIGLEGSAMSSASAPVMPESKGYARGSMRSGK
jgi:hypothetical protein